MKNPLKIVSLIIVLALFTLMALGSGSSSSGSSSSTTGKEESTSSSSTSTSDSAESINSDADEVTIDDASTESESSSANEPAYEVGDGKVITFTSYDTTWIQICVPVINTGDMNLYLEPGTMDLEDADGHLVDSKSLVSVYPQVLEPGETAWYYEETTLDQAPESELAVLPHVDVKESKVDCVRYEISDLSLVDEEYGGIKITGRVKNGTDNDGSMVYVVANLFDSNNELLGQVFTILDNDLKAGDQIGFSATTFAPNDAFTTENVDHYDVYAFPYQYQF